MCSEPASQNTQYKSNGLGVWDTYGDLLEGQVIVWLKQLHKYTSDCILLITYSVEKRWTRPPSFHPK